MDRVRSRQISNKTWDGFSDLAKRTRLARKAKKAVPLQKGQAGYRDGVKNVPKERLAPKRKKS